MVIVTIVLLFFRNNPEVQIMNSDFRIDVEAPVCSDEGELLVEFGDVSKETKGQNLSLGYDGGGGYYL
jgi:hypothetical protein